MPIADGEPKVMSVTAVPTGVKSNGVPSAQMHNLRVGASHQITAPLKHAATPTNVPLIAGAHPDSSTQQGNTETRVEYSDDAASIVAMLDAVTPSPKAAQGGDVVLPEFTTHNQPQNYVDNVANGPEDVAVLESQRKGIIFYYRGYLHNRKGKELADGSYAAQCIEYERGCKGRARFSPAGNFLYWVRDHIHEPKEHALAIALHTNRVRNIVRVGVASMKPTHVIMAANSQLSMEELVHGPKDITLARRIGRQKSKVDGVAPPIAPLTLDKVPYLIDPRFASIDWYPSKPGTQIENTLLIDDGVGRDGNRPRIMGQLSHSGISLISKGRHFAGDGTFGIAPHVFTQIYTLQVFVGAEFRAVPVAIFYLPNKEKRTYIRMFALLKQLVFDVTGVNFIMETLVIDFETGVDIAATMIWTDIKIFYCLFHLSKSVYKHVKSEKLENEYIDNAEFRKSVRHLVSLAFLPPEDVIDVFQQMKWHPLIADIVSSWFEPYYIGSVILGVRQPPMFAISKWNVHSRVLAGQPRSNNALEGLNSTLMTVIGRSHPTIFVSLVGMAGFLRQVHVGEMHIKQGKHKRGARYVGSQTETQIVRTVKNYVAGDVYKTAVEFLSAINNIVNMGGSVEKAIRKAEAKQREIDAAAAEKVVAATDIVSTSREFSTPEGSVNAHPLTFNRVAQVDTFVATLQTRPFSHLCSESGADVQSNDVEFFRQYKNELRDKKKEVVPRMPAMVLFKSNAGTNEVSESDGNDRSTMSIMNTSNTSNVDGTTDDLIDSAIVPKANADEQVDHEMDLPANKSGNKM